MWGNNLYGQLGDGTFASKNRPTFLGSDYLAISGGFTHTLVIKSVEHCGHGEIMKMVS